jgi:membrane peptidoglycan carboxypeptidase
MTGVPYLNMLKKLFFLITGFTGMLIVAGLGAFFWLVVFNPGDEILQGNIEKILSMESPVFYSDEDNKIGVFFKDAHRQYIRYEEIPQNFINAIVASEDNDFFKHHGVDIAGIVRALVANIKAGKVVQGGSTITQQTAKNLFKRKDRSLKSKLTELLYALRLEYHYPKEKIMEFYANQFYVSGNGHGLGVAAQYYFNKPAAELDLVESAFIAGSVKRPNYYNPFIKKDEERAALARQRAQKRLSYVLLQMHKLGMISTEQYQEEKQRQISFEQGRMFFPLNTLMDFVKSGLDVPEVEEALAKHGIDNVATSGIKIYTTIEKPLQDQAFYALRKELSRLSVRLEGYEQDKVQNFYKSIPQAGDWDIGKGSFLMGKVTNITSTPEPQIFVSVGPPKGSQEKHGVIDRQGIWPVVDSLVKWEKQRWTEAKNEDLDRFLKQLEIGDLIFVSVRSIDNENGEMLLDLERYPELQGALLAMQDGTIRAMVGGMENHYFNRAIAAKRPLGSVMKPLVYTAALQLGWNSIDALKNNRSLFIYQNQPYFPRPDHKSPHSNVSMNWAGVFSENIATVWLLYHLCDHLTPAQFRQLIAHLDMDRREFESYAGYSQRIRDNLGIVVDEVQLQRAALRKAIRELEPDLIFDGKYLEYQQLKELHYGADFETYFEDVENLQGAEYESQARQAQVIKEEKAIRKKILRHNYLHLLRLREELQYLSGLFSNRSLTPQTLLYNEFLGQFYYDPLQDVFIYGAEPFDESNWQYLNYAEVRKLLQSKSFTRMKKTFQKAFWENILLEGKLSATTFDLLHNTRLSEYDKLAAQPAYSFDVLQFIPDFRVLAGLRYLIALGRSLNIQSELEPVLSFPLGSNVISLLEAAVLYQGIATGSITVNSFQAPIDELAIIERIENAEGETIFTPERNRKKVVDDRTAIAVSNILQNVVRFGTGRFAHTNVRLHSRDPETEEQLQQFKLTVPVLGKTGTANRFTNSTFLGLVPSPIKNKNKFSLENGYTVAAYVGYDDNSPMVRNTTHITGSSGALPVWTRMANAILYEKGYGDSLDLVDIAFSSNALTGETGLGLDYADAGQISATIVTGNGLPLQSQPAPSLSDNKQTTKVITFGTIMPSGEVEPARNFKPFWEN